MNWNVNACWLWLLLASGAVAQDNDQGPYVEVRILAIEVSPTKRNGKPWDASRRTGRSIGQAVSVAARVPGGGRIGAAATQVVAPPDVYGFVNYRVRGADLGRFPLIPRSHPRRATRVLLQRKPGLAGFRYGKDSHVEITLRDADVTQDDPIGTAKLLSRDFAQSVRSNLPVWIDISEQSGGTVLRIKVEARLIPPTAPTLLR